MRVCVGEAAANDWLDCNRERWSERRRDFPLDEQKQTCAQHHILQDIEIQTCRDTPHQEDHGVPVPWLPQAVQEKMQLLRSPENSHQRKTFRMSNFRMPQKLYSEREPDQASGAACRSKAVPMLHL